MENNTNSSQTGNNQIPRIHHKIDATDRIPGRLASEIAILLMGKHKVTYQPYLDQGDFVEISNVAKMKFTGKKLDQKSFYSFSGFPGGLKTIGLGKLFKDNPEEVLRKIVHRMLPKNKLRQEMIKRLTFKSDKE